MLCRNRYASNLFIPISLIAVVSTTCSYVLLRREQFDTTSRISSAHRTSVLNLCFALFTFLGSDNDHTRVRTCTIDSSSRTVLKNVHRLDVVRVEVVHTSTWNTIDNVKRCSRTSERTCTTDLHAKAAVGRVTTTIFRHGQTSDLTLEKTFSAIESTLIEVLGLDRSYRTSNLLLSL